MSALTPEKENNEAKTFLAIAAKNGLLSREEASACLRICIEEGRSAGDVVRERKSMPEDKVALVEGAIRKMQAPSPTPAAPPSPPAQANEPVPGYPIVGKLGVGGTATVFLAEDPANNGRKVALKILKPTLGKDPKALENFLREAELLKKFRHPNIVEGYDFGTAGPLSFMVLEYLEGESVWDLIEREGALPEARALEIILEAGKALTYIQQNKIIHRDIKPDNLMVVGEERVVLCDLGFAIPMGDADAADAAAHAETTSGTVQYMSPEQARGQMDLDIRTDIYSLGATLYHMVMGAVPFSGDDSHDVMAKQVMEALNSTEIKNRRISRHMHYFIERMMSKDKHLRYATPEELVDDITEQIEGFRSLEYRPPEPRKPERKPMTGRVSRTTRIFRQGDLPGESKTEKGKRPPIDKKRIQEITKRFRRR